MPKKYPNEYKVYSDHAVMIIFSPTYGTFEFEIDLDDLEKVKAYQWGIMVAKAYGGEIGQYYAMNQKLKMLLHRFVVNASKDEIIDHADQNTFNTRKSNLRKCNKSQNSHNIKVHKNNKSGYPGVFWYDKMPTPKWIAFIKVNYKYINLGYYEDLEDAIQARKDGELKYFGEFKSSAY